MAHEPEVMYESELAARYASTYYAKAISWADSYYILQGVFPQRALSPRRYYYLSLSQSRRYAVIKKFFKFFNRMLIFSRFVIE